jgi:hypothetical protein
VLHFHTSSSCEQKLHDVALSYQLIELWNAQGTGGEHK